MHRIFWALLVLFLFAAFLRQDWIYYLVYVVAGVWVFSYWWVRRVLKQMTVERHMLDRAFTGEKLPVRVTIQNHSLLPLPWLQVQEQVTPDLKDQPNYRVVMSVGGHTQAVYDYQLYCKRRGYYPLGPLQLRAGDLFGFSTVNWEELGGRHVTVYPQVLPLEKLGLPSRSPFGALPSRQRLFEDPARMAGVRDYVTGDSLRYVHWKASAHEDSLLVKKFQPAIALDVTIALDLNRAGYEPVGRGIIGYSEWAITVAASLASYVVDQRQPVGLICNGHDPLAEATASPVPVHHGQGQLMNILSLLARVELDTSDATLAAWLPPRLADLAWGTTLILVTPHLNEDVLWQLHGAYRRGSNALVLICAPQADYHAMHAQAERLGVTVYRTIWEQDLDQLAAER